MHRFQLKNADLFQNSHLLGNPIRGQFFCSTALQILKWANSGQLSILPGFEKFQFFAGYLFIRILIFFCLPGSIQQMK